MQGLPYAVINIPTRQKQTTFCLFFNIEGQLEISLLCTFVMIIKNCPLNSKQIPK